MMRWLCVFCIVPLLSGCSTKYVNTLAFDPREPLRVAVLPFLHGDATGAAAPLDDSLWIDNVSVVSSKLRQPPERFVRKLVLDGLQRSGLDVLPANSISGTLVHSGFGLGHEIDLLRVHAAAPRELCLLLGCDALVYGKLTRWERSYYAIQSVSTVGVELKLVRGVDGAVLFSSSATDSDSRGVTKIPTGFSDLVLEPIRGLDNEIIVDLSRRLVRKMLLPLTVEERSAALASDAPVIEAVVQTAVDGVVSRDRPLAVALSGSPGHRAFFSIGSAFENVPMVEREPGHYLGELYPLPSDRFENQPLRVVLTDAFGRETRSELSRTLLSLR